jgi:thiamine monophosphate kinase
VNRRLFIGLLAGVIVAGATANAHHSFAATYLTDKEVKIEGDMIQFMFRNPHSFVHVMGPDETGQMQRWAVEWAAAGQLTGITRDTLKPGDHVIITGNPGRTADDHRLRMRSILRPKDGFKWSGDFQ